MAENQLLHRLFDTSSPCVSETFAGKVVQNAAQPRNSRFSFLSLYATTVVCFIFVAMLHIVKR